jgi:hypothetical protein
MQQLKDVTRFLRLPPVTGGTLKLYEKQPGGLKRKIRRLAPGVSFCLDSPHTQAIAVKNGSTRILAETLRKCCSSVVTNQTNGHRSPAFFLLQQFAI